MTYRTLIYSRIKGQTTRRLFDQKNGNERDETRGQRPRSKKKKEETSEYEKNTRQRQRTSYILTWSWPGSNTETKDRKGRKRIENRK